MDSTTSVNPLPDLTRICSQKKQTKDNPIYRKWRKEYTEKNRERLNAIRRQWRKEHPEQSRLTNKIWRDKNPQKVFDNNLKYRIKMGMRPWPEVRQKFIEAGKIWQANNKEAMRAQWTPERRRMQSELTSKRMSRIMAGKCYTTCHGGVREDLGIYFRSSWEANYARYLNFLIAHEDKIERWEYEPETFWFHSIKRGVRSYKPDFKVFLKSGEIEYHEVKGWMYPRAKTALKRMAKYYPHIKMVLIDQVRYRALHRQLKSIIHNWECGGKRVSLSNPTAHHSDASSV